MREIRLTKRTVEVFREIARRDWGRGMSSDEARAVAELFLATVANGFRMGSGETSPSSDTEAYVPGPPKRCGLCGSAKRSERVSFTEHGPLCAACEEAIADGTLPSYMASERDRWYSARDLCLAIGVTPARLAALVRKGKLVARTVPRTGFRVFLDEDQPNYERAIAQTQRGRHRSDELDRHSEPREHGV